MYIKSLVIKSIHHVNQVKLPARGMPVIARIQQVRPFAVQADLYIFRSLWGGDSHPFPASQVMAVYPGWFQEGTSGKIIVSAVEERDELAEIRALVEKLIGAEQALPGRRFQD